MRYGEDGESSASDVQNGSEVVRESTPDDIGRSIFRIAVAQLCQSVGFQSIRTSSLDSLSDIAIRYICDLGKASRSYAAISGRTDCNVFDIIQGLADMGFSYGESYKDHSPSRSIVISPIIKYVNTVEEVPFPCPIPHYPISPKISFIPSFQQFGETPPGSHMPNWLPALPDPHTYIHTPAWNERVLNPKADTIEQGRQRRKAEKSLLILQKRLSNASDASIPTQARQGSTWIVNGPLIETQEAIVKPFLISEKEEVSVSQLFSPVDFSVQKRSFVLETLAPIIEVLKNEALEPEDGEKNPSSLNKFPIFHLKSGINDKTLMTPLSLNTKGSAESTSWLSMDDKGQGRDDKKRRARLILQESWENPQELHQL
ncbi:hypothetical protein ZOSMA_205G00140 [Zostera marina]|uniref:Transcription initiation factor TFIID subunit 8 n=1 Tax=Zostera marina TaxID=29655 RepID=A0A0K9PL99_ZOSMR|nr:hypothetical protein ZOSMA_205G00140 [Zostera marina]